MDRAQIHLVHQKKQLGHCLTIGGDVCLQGHPERVLKVNHVAGVFIFTKNQFSQLFLQEK